MEKPNVDQIEGLSPAISIDQKGSGRNPRSTVGTVTEVYDYLRLLYARVGQPHCPTCGEPISQQSATQIVDSILEMPEGSRILVMAPLIKDRKGQHKNVFEDLQKQGYVRVRVNGEIYEIGEVPDLDRYKMHTIEAVVDRLVVRRPEPDPENPDAISADLTRLSDSVETALRLGEGVMIVSDVSDRDHPVDRTYSEHFSCIKCGTSLPEIEPRTFSFNSPHGACPTCTGLGSLQEFDPELIIDDALSLEDGAVIAWRRQNDDDNDGYYGQVLQAVCRQFAIPYKIPVKELSSKQRDIILFGPPRKDKIRIEYKTSSGDVRYYDTGFSGVIPSLQRRYQETNSEYIRSKLEEFMSLRPCPTCEGKRLRPEALAVLIDGQNIYEVTHRPVDETLAWVHRLQGIVPTDLLIEMNGAGSRGYLNGNSSSVNGNSNPAASPLTPRQQTIAEQVLKEIAARLGFMVNVGLDYLTLDRTAVSLSGGESQRIRLATQIGSQLMGVLYILDEPSIGLHQRDNARLIDTLMGMRDLGNTVLVVEHDEDTIRAADWVVDMGPGAGEHGGHVVASLPQAEFIDSPASLTAQYLRGEKRIEIPAERREGNGNHLTIRGASENNLRNVDVDIPLGKFVAVTGVSGSGKSTLVVEVLYKRLAQMMYRAKERPGKHTAIEGIEYIDKIIEIDQSPIGRTPRSNPATYVGLFTYLRELYASLPEAKARGYKAGRFSFNIKGGRCETCQGDGIIRIEMQFLPDVYVPCEECKGKRYNRETLEIKFRGKSIADALEMTVEEGLEFFQNIPRIRSKLETLNAVGLGYVKLGQPATTLSGGEAQRIKLSKELSRRATGNTFYILDEPTTGLHFEDVRKLLQVLHELVNMGNTVLVIEHNLDVIKSCDWLIDMGPEGGNKGGYVLVEGTPEHVAETPKSYTGRFLAPILERDRQWALAAAAD
jgi:excinuclease ABC subunit A